MSDTTGLAAVHAAAEAVSRTDHQAAVAAARAEGHAAGLKEGREAGIKAGAEAERARIAGIEAHALAGHEALISECKADAACTPEMAASRILGAEKALRARQVQGVKDVETITGKVTATAPAAIEPAPGKSVETATTPEGWKAEYEKSAALQAEFPTIADYVAVKKAEADGRVKVLGGAVRK